MTYARAHLVDEDNGGFYHCTSQAQIQDIQDIVNALQQQVVMSIVGVSCWCQALAHDLRPRPFSR